MPGPKVITEPPRDAPHAPGMPAALPGVPSLLSLQVGRPCQVPLQCPSGISTQSTSTTADSVEDEHVAGPNCYIDPIASATLPLGLSDDAAASTVGDPMSRAVPKHAMRQ